MYYKSTLFELISYVSGTRAKKKSSESKIRRYKSTLGCLLTEKKPEVIKEMDAEICSLQRQL
jgi:hypothetical protein